MPVSQECLETRTKESTRLEPWIGGELWIACEGTGVSTGGRAHSSLFFCSADQGVQRRVQVFVRIVWRPTVIFRVPGP